MSLDALFVLGLLAWLMLLSDVVLLLFRESSLLTVI